MTIKTPCPALFVFVCSLFICTGLFAQEEEPKVRRGYKPREQKLYIDIPLTIAEDTIINLAGNMYWRLWGPDWELAYFTADSIRYNLNPRVWEFEAGQGGDTFLVNQLFHPYAGAVYFASGRSNNLNFYWSILSSTFGSLSWEALGELASPSSSDVISTAFGGIVLGEILHRLYIELDRGGVAGKIGATLLSPTDRITAAVRGYGPYPGRSAIDSASLTFGFSWMNAGFFEKSEQISFWNMPSAFIGFDLEYGDPYTAHSKTPFTQFDAVVSLTASAPLVYNLTIIAGGYLASWLLADDEVDQASNGLSLHFDNFVTDKGGIMALNNGRENLSFNANSLDYTLQWRRMLNQSFEFSLKTHAGFSPWVIADYNGGVNRDDYNLYLIGANVKLFAELRQRTEESRAKPGHSLALSLCFYETWNIPNTPGFDINTRFLFSKIAYSFPLSGRLSLYAADSFLLLHCRMTHDEGPQFPDLTRWYNSFQIGMKFSF
jgi:hypothetical protein